jgi:hypothetical protein
MKSAILSVSVPDHFYIISGTWRVYTGRRERGFISTGKLLSDADAVVILTALIKHHGISVENIMELPEVRKRDFSQVVIREFLDRHDLLKKTLTTKP